VHSYQRYVNECTAHFLICKGGENNCNALQHYYKIAFRDCDRPHYRLENKSIRDDKTEALDSYDRISTSARRPGGVNPGT